MTGFEGRRITDEVLRTTRAALLHGLDRIAAHIAADTFHIIGPKGEASPAQAGQLTRILLEQIDAELARREGATP